MSIKRREFILRGTCLATLVALVGPEAGKAITRTPGDSIPPVEARWWESLDSKRVECTLCPKKCTVDDLERGYCGVRENRDGTYYTHVYAAACAVHTDPIEKKPLFHFLPGTRAFSIATAGCNMDCAFCQNWQISQVRPEQVDAYYLRPQDVASAAIGGNAHSIAYTYSEPVVFYEYMYDCAEYARTRGVRSVMVSNGYIQEKPLRELCRVLDAIKVDLKSFREKYYREVCAGELQPVLDALEVMRQEGVWLELVYLMVPTLNDSETEIEELCAWVFDKLGPGVPVHFTRFHPQYRLKHLPSTPVSSLERALNIARRAGLQYVYLGNVPGHESESTRCPACNAVVVRRVGYT
ncbi:MAG: AmmeMemoRadiSam system radical SAM enzyme, partial [Gemmatimonadota bacterium]|nr:AmmeMemoRadiSam system radical SAM enzyme [Gemmatimonadota bacterium]